MTGQTKTEDEVNYTVATNDDLLAALNKLILQVNLILKTLGMPKQ